MALSRSPKYIVSKLGLVSALALGSSPLLGAEALATPVAPSDTFQLVGGVNGTVQTLSEGSREVTLSDTFSYNEAGEGFIAGTKTIVLTDPGTSNISDIVTATLAAPNTEGFHQLTVTFTSDGETPLTTTFDLSIAETGGIQNLGPDFTSLFGASNPLPTINVSSDISDTSQVPEPGSFALLGAGLAGLAFARRRRKA
jgi:hypothetical protein